ncbi:MAG: hypothetical protein ACOZF2_01875, partial [Thermodesulfobacteriota bacterium]
GEPCVRPGATGEHKVRPYSSTSFECELVSDKEKEALSLVAETFVLATDAQVGYLLQEDSIMEVQHHE